MSNNDIVTISPNVLPSLDTVSHQVSNDGAGAIVTFSGCTRDTFQGKRVLRLEYEAYEPMAIKVLKELIAEARGKWDLTHVAIYHRTGVVPVSQVSVIIAVSSAHRAEAFRASEYLIDTLKERCPIWKKEVYEDGSVWKGQCCNHNQA
ncbi:molybdopterin synthase catalytic subunit-like [Lichtheimia corymbifera JMRC:FSU:9682]|uniref:Molybdopterin synthase catalytic subunit-like n=1 Tax=Lichtheimia corymbifera JMRC:FSU:9682 TaxID=1263082 RepID=A0A068SDI1_9FUNG|nr:molybdopterin synthase catalytic subunit-like [Lichtheimia corymbifera JMRC:FSU:9682]